MPKAKKDKIMFYGTGRRKSSIARVRLVEGTGVITINGKNIDEYLGYHHKYLEDIKVPEPKENNRTHYGRVHLTDRSARERKHNFEPIENGMSYDEAMQECGKCLRCDHFGCSVVKGGII